MDPKRALTLRKFVFAGLLAAMVVAAIWAFVTSRPTIVPEEAKRRINPIQSSPSALGEARGVYRERCAHCHGDTGRGDGPDAQKHNISATDFTNAQRENLKTDGELFYLISEGRRPMPAFKSRLSEETRWELVLLVRSFAAGGANPASGQPPADTKTP
jgi:mono/diheme cytochrome c family protein